MKAVPRSSRTNKRGINKAEENDDDDDDYGDDDDDDHPSPSSQTQPCERLVLRGTVRRAKSKFKLFKAMVYKVDVNAKICRCLDDAKGQFEKLTLVWTV